MDEFRLIYHANLISQYFLLLLLMVLNNSANNNIKYIKSLLRINLYCDIKSPKCIKEFQF